jgi:hypothetical protein
MRPLVLMTEESWLAIDAGRSGERTLPRASDELTHMARPQGSNSLKPETRPVVTLGPIRFVWNPNLTAGL